MSTKQDKLKTYIITLRPIKGSNDVVIIEQQGKSMMVNNRGDLLITSTFTSYETAKVIACFTSGSWLRAKEKTI